MALSPAELLELEAQLLEHAKATFGVRQTATLISDRITLVHSNATKARDDLARIAAEALAKEGADAASVEADRARLATDIDRLEGEKVSRLEAEAVHIATALEELKSLGDSAREHYVTSGGKVPDGGWDAAGEACRRKSDADAAAERETLEICITQAAASAKAH